MQSARIDHTAHLLGHYLAERTFGRLVRNDNDLPPEWPGSIDDARQIAAQFADPEERDSLAERVQGQASEAWMQLRAASR
jgi:hypothetical protein